MRRIPMAGLALALTLGAAPMLAAQSPHGRARAEQGARQDRGPGQRLGQSLFRGIDLSSGQRSRIQQIREHYADQTKQLRERMRPAIQEARADHQRGDDDAARKVFQRTEKSRDQMRKIRERELKDIRGVLDSGQRRTFDANVSRMREQMKQRAGHARENGQWTGRQDGQRQGGQQHGRDGQQQGRWNGSQH